MTLMHVYVPIETFNISFESTQDKQQYGTKITGTEEGNFFVVLPYSPQPQSPTLSGVYHKSSKVIAISLSTSSCIVVVNMP